MCARPKSTTPRRNVSTIRFTDDEQAHMAKQAHELGFKSISEYIRFLHKKQVDESGIEVQKEPTRYDSPDKYFSTRYGKAMHGDSLGLLHGTLKANSVDLIMTSPPFGLVRKKAYGNEHANDYLDWFRPFAEGFKKVLKPEGSLVIDIGGAWNAGQPTRSLYHYELLVMLCREYGFHLALEHFWWNPAKLPTPAEWVNIRRVRVKDAVNCVWWLSPTPWPKASNKRILAPYSDSMKSLLTNGYKAKLRPSGHNISEKFGIDNGGSIPPNLLAIANTESNGAYQTYCRDNNLPVHPARFPSLLPEYFVKMCTDKGDVVVDPFGGSCITGEVCERLERKWICCELQKDYLDGAKGRFQSNSLKEQTPPVKYEIFSPCAMPITENEKLDTTGGLRRNKVINGDAPTANMV